MRLLFELFISFFKVGAFTFGGGLAMLPVIRKVAVEEKHWLDDEEMIDCLALSQSLPGMLAINAAIYIGNRKKGFAGAVVAAVGAILPSFITIIVVLTFLGQIEDNRYVQGAFEGIKAASVALILVAALRMGKKVITGKFEWVIAIVAFVLILMGVNAIWAIVSGGVIGYAGYKYRSKRKKGDVS